MHIPHVLYHWREHPASGSAGGKPDARRTNLAALAEAMERRGHPADIIELPTANRARLRLAGSRRVSIVIPTDSLPRATAAACTLPAATSWSEIEFLIVTNSGVIEALRANPAVKAAVRFLPYDEPFNFSDKCNLAADEATGDRLIFLNDDVEAMDPAWVGDLIEQLEDPGVGAVAPKLLYETGLIQHAGLVMGVRGLAGTAFHQLPHDFAQHANLAQSLREVSALSGACLAMRRDDFLRLGGFDAINTPIAHSDIDLCFKVREAGLRCVYTPFTTLRHVGHASLETVEPAKKEARDKASIFLLRRWGEYSTHDPYFTGPMREWLYHDSPTPVRMSGRNNPESRPGRADLLLVSHDLSLSGAPMMLLQAARWCRANGIFCVVMSPLDGPLRKEFEKEGIPVLIDPLVNEGHRSFVDFARPFDVVIANTIFGAPVVNALAGSGTPVIWWLHETEVGEHYLQREAGMRAALPRADLVMAPSERACAVYRPYTDRAVVCLRNAITPPAPEIPEGASVRSAGPLKVVLLGTVEPRKGQDILLDALSGFPASAQPGLEVLIAGRVHDPAFGAEIARRASALPNVQLTGPVTHAEALRLLSGADVVVFPSRDEAMPTVTMLEAMSMAKPIVSTTVGGALEFLRHNENALLVNAESAPMLAVALDRLAGDEDLRRSLGEEARKTFQERFTLDRFGREFEGLVESQLGRSLEPAEENGVKRA